MLTDEQIEAIYKQETGALIDDSPWALVDFSRAIEAAATEPLLQRIAELEEMNAQLREQNTEVDKTCAELERQLEEARKDAERYRWLRESKCPMAVISEDCLVLGMSYMDECIDEAMKGKE